MPFELSRPTDGDQSADAQPDFGSTQRNLGGPVYRLRVNINGQASVVEIVFRLGGVRNGVQILSRRLDWLQPEATGEAG
jgi:hypothetical protein